jgi:hypothetical protein
VCPLGFVLSCAWRLTTRIYSGDSPVTVKRLLRPGRAGGPPHAVRPRNMPTTEFGRPRQDISDLISVPRSLASDAPYVRSEARKDDILPVNAVEADVIELEPVVAIIKLWRDCSGRPGYFGSFWLHVRTRRSRALHLERFSNAISAWCCRAAVKIIECAEPRTQTLRHTCRS